MEMAILRIDNDPVWILGAFSVLVAYALFVCWMRGVEARSKWPRLRVRKRNHVTLRPLFNGDQARLSVKDYESVRRGP